MTSNHRAKQDARARQAATGEPYTAARRRTSKSAPRRFEPDHCANCMIPLPLQIERLFCSELCRQTADVIRYWRGISRDGRIEQDDVKIVLRTRIAHLLAGGYAEQDRRISPATRRQVWDRDQGQCRQCGDTGQEIDHIDGDSPKLSNLQLLCTPCHQRKTERRMVPASPDHQLMIEKLRRERVAPDEPVLLCDDRDQWSVTERQLRKERRRRLLEELDQCGYSRTDFSGCSWAEMWDQVLDEQADALDYGGWTPEDDSGYGPYSYFAHAMAKDD